MQSALYACPGWVLPYTSYLGMCGAKGYYGFLNRFGLKSGKVCTVSSEWGMVLEEATSYVFFIS